MVQLQTTPKLFKPFFSESPNEKAAGIELTGPRTKAGEASALEQLQSETRQKL